MSLYTAIVRVGSMVVGPGEQEHLVFETSQCVCTWSWGLQPARALVEWASRTPPREVLDVNAPMTIMPKALLTIEVGGHTFYGFCESAVPVMGSEGYSLMQEFVDSRALLQWDKVKAAFNIRDHRIVNGRWIRRYKHILPWDFPTRLESYTTTPYSARQILDMLFLAPTTEFPWERIYHPVMENTAVFGLDWTQGRTLGQAVLEVTQRLGLTFTLLGGRWRLVWALKGVGDNVPFPPNSDNRRRGTAISGNPTRVELLGGRNLYQVMNIPMIPDWADGWSAYGIDFHAFVRDLYLYGKTEAPVAGVPAGTPYASIDPEDDGFVGFLLAQARAETITIGQYADMVDARGGRGEVFRDYRRFMNRSRLDMPVRLYLSQVVFRAFRFYPGFTFRNVNGNWIGLRSVQIAEQALVQVTHDPVTGDMFYDPILPSQPNGYAIVQGYQVASDAFKTLHPEYFDVTDWVGAQALWQAAQFHVDNSGEGDQFIIFEQPVIKSADIIQMDVTGKYPGVNAQATLQIPAVRVALTFAAEEFSFTEGFGTRDEIQNVPDLHAEHISLGPGWDPQELLFADGQTAREKAALMLAPLLIRQFYYVYGGYLVQGSNATQLTPMLDRVTVRLNPSGLTEEVDFTNERSRNVAIVSGARGTVVQVQTEPERNFERVAQLAPLLPGQAELRETANQLRSEAALLLKNPRLTRMIVDTFHLLLGLDALPEAVRLNGTDGAPMQLLPLGTPLFREATGKNPWLPNNAGLVQLTQPIFEGVTVVKNERSDGPVRLTRTGNNGRIFVRVQGPVAVNGGLGIPTDDVSGDPAAKNYLVAQAGTTPSVAMALETVADGVIQLIQASVLGAGGVGIECPYG